MSDTDDTDDLLLIPPDFFTVDYDRTTPFYTVVDTLIEQIDKLDKRLYSIENSPNRSIDFSTMYASNSSEDIDYTQRGSTQSTPQKPKNKFFLRSLPTTPNVDSRFGKSSKNQPEIVDRNKKVNVVLDEVDKFISNVQTMKRLGTARNLENEFDKNPFLTPIDDFLRKNVEEKMMRKEKAWKCGEQEESVPDYGLGMKHLMFADNAIEQQTGETLAGETNSDGTSDTSQATALLQKPIEKQVDQHSDLNKSLEMEIISLSKLWNDKPVTNQNISKSTQKLQEEKFRRQHCEQLVQKLQNHILELEQRLSVAIKVDDAKDKAILRFHDAWEKINTKLELLEKEKEQYEQEMHDLKNKNLRDSEENSQKIGYYETELSKTLNLLQTNKEKIIYFENKCVESQNQLGELQKKYEDIQQNYRNEVEKNKKFPEILTQKEFELNEHKTLLNEARKAVTQTKKSVDVYQKEFTSLKNECDELRTKLQEEMKNSNQLNDNQDKLVGEIEIRKRSEKNLQDELKKMKEQMDNNKKELKNYYQGQLELVIQNKVKEFQNQLDQAENALKEDFRKREMIIIKNAASHMHQMCEKQSQEIQLLEEKHREELRLHQIKLSQSKQQIDEISRKYQKQQERRALIDRQLIKFMESLQQDESFAGGEQMSSTKTKSITNLEDILLQNIDESYEQFTKNIEEPLKQNAKQILEDIKDLGEIGRNKSDGHKVAGEPQTSSKKHKMKQFTEDNLQKYIQLLLEKQTLHTESDHKKDAHERHISKSDFSEVNPTNIRNNQKDKRLEKPPWK